MARTLRSLALLAFLFGALAAAPAVTAAGLLQDGNIVVPGEGCLWKVGSPNPTAWLTSDAFGWAYDAMEDSQGRIVFIAGAGRSSNSVALFRADPATGSLERLLPLEYIVLPGDTLPDGLEATGFYGERQSLHIEKTFKMTINDTVNGGVPQVGMAESYAFSIAAAIGGVMHGVSIRWLTDEQKAEQGIDVSGATTVNAVAMTAGGGTVYYGLNGTIYKAGPQLEVEAHFSLEGLGTVDAHLRVTPTNEQLYSNPILDDTNIPNISATCGSTTDTEVPMVGGGFAPLTVWGLGTLGGSLYATTNEGGSGTPYEFALAPRPPFLNPYICLYYPAVKFTGGTPWALGDTMAVTPNRGDSPDGGSVLANADGNILSVSPGSVAHLGRFAGYRGRPLRWHSPVALAAGRAAHAEAQGDTSLGALVVRVDSLVRVMVTDPLGRRIGVTAADSVVNDFGSSGLVSALGPSGWPRLITIVGPAQGNHVVDIAGAGSGTYGVTAYLAETSIGGAKSPTTGTIGAGETRQRVLKVLQPLTLGWVPENTGAGDRQVAGTFGFDWVGPVPAASAVRFACRTPGSGSVRLEMFDLSGRRVATLGGGRRAAGPFTLTWSGRGDDGRRLPAGVYMARLSMPGMDAVRRVVLAR